MAVIDYQCIEFTTQGRNIRPVITELLVEAPSPKPRYRRCQVDWEWGEGVTHSS